MGKKNKKSSPSGDDLVKNKKLKESSTSGDVEVAHVHSLKKGNSTLAPCSGSKGNLKNHNSEENDDEEKIDQKNEIKELSKSIKELTEAIKKQQDSQLTRFDIFQILSLKEREAIQEREEEESVDFCCFDCEEAGQVNTDKTIIVKGIGFLEQRKEVKRVLRNIFGPCGEITRIFAPVECSTRESIGYAFIDLKNGEGNEKALKLDGLFVETNQIEVKLAKDTVEYYAYSNFGGCDRCLKQRYRRLERNNFMPVQATTASSFGKYVAANYPTRRP